MADYTPPYIDETGMHTPSYTEIRDVLIEEMKSIYGEDIYISEDSMDYQMISIFAKKIYDTNNLALLAYNNRTPITAIGVGLDNTVVYAGISRKPATYSTVQLTITGDAGTVIINGEASDGTNKWDLPSSVTIPENGIITVEAQCHESGNIGAMPNTITTIVTPVYGWLSVTNNNVASAGTNVESDASLRGRFGLSTYSPSITVMDGIQAEIEQIDGVGRVVGYENDTSNESTGTVPPNIPGGLPPHSITYVVEGGDQTEIASAIYNKKTPGCYTNGTTEVQLYSEAGNVNTIRFYVNENRELQMEIAAKKLSGYNDEYENKIKAAIIEYVNTLPIGESVYPSYITSIAMGAQDTLKSPAFVILNVNLSDNEQKFYQTWLTDESKITINWE